MTLALLLTAATGAWADGIVCTASDLGKVLCTDGSIYENVSAATTAGKEAAAVIAYVDETNKNGLALALTDEEGIYTWDNSAPSNNGKTAPEICSALNTSKAVTGGTWKLPSQDEWKQMFSANGGNEGSYTGLNTAIGNAGGTALLESEDYWSSSEVDEGYAWLVHLADGNASWSDEGKHYSRQVRACLAFDIASPITVEPGEAANTWTFTMPGSDVVLTPIYANAAAFATTGTGSEATTLLPAAAEGVIAGTDDPLIAENTGIVANIGSTETAQGTLMYAIGTSDTEAPELTEFSATVPTAKDVADGGATVYVWYYIQGADAPQGEAATLDNTFNDTEPACLTVQVLTNKFDISFKAANDNTIEAGKATVTVDGTDKTVTEGKLQGVKMGSEVKLKAATGYKFRNVEVKKAEAAPAISFSKQSWGSAESAPANFISVSQADAKAAADAEKTQANAPGYVCIYALEGGVYKWIDSHGRTGQHSGIADIANAQAWDEVYECYNAGVNNCIWFTVEPAN